MFGTENFFVFLVAGITLNLIPGPDTMYIIGRTISQGRQAGFMSVLGISSGALVHTIAAALGLSTIFITSPLAFNVVKWIGTAYLVYLGGQMIFSPPAEAETQTGKTAQSNLRRIYRQGLLTNIFNPKVAMFFIAFLPQFVNTEQASTPLPFIFLGTVFVITGTVWCLFVATVAARASTTVRSNSYLLNIVQKFTGLLFIGLGVRLATQNL